MIELKTKSNNDHIFLFKTTKHFNPEEVIQKIQTTKKQNTHFDFNDIF
jgi:hypothetical protein